MPLASSTNLTDLTGVKIPNQWMRGGNAAFVDTPTIYGGGTNDLVLIGHNDSRIYVYTSQDRGVTWNTLSLVASDPIYPDDAPNSVCLTSDGRVHCVSKSFQYARLNLVRSGGHVTGYSWDTATALAIPTVSDSGAYYVHYFPVIKRVVNGLGNECLFVSISCTAGEETDTLRLGAFVTTGITPAADTDFRSLSGTAAAATTLWSTNRTTDGASGYETWADSVQHPTSSVNYFVFGQGANETTWTNAPLGYYPITPNAGASTWTVGSQVIVGRGSTSGPGWHLWGTAQDASNIYFAYDPAATGPKIGRIDGSGTLTASFLTIEALSVNAIGTFDCTPDGTKFFVCYCTNWNANPTRTSKRAYYESGSWNYVDDNGSFDTTAWLPGHSKVSHCGTLSGLVAILCPDNNYTDAHCDYWVSTMWAATTQSVSCVQSPAEPTETGANPFQNLNYVAAAQSPAQPRQIASAIEAAIPTVVGAGAFGDGSTSAAVPLPANIVKGDILIALCESANQAVTNSNAAGGTWTEVTNSPQGTGTAGGTSATRITAFWSRYNGTQTQPTFACTGGNHVNGAIVAVRGCVPEGSPIHVSTGGVKATSSTTTSIAGSTTTKGNCLVVAAVSRMNDAATAHYSGWTNASLSNVTEILDGGGTAGNGGGIGACAGGLASAGTYGATTATNATTTTNGFMTLALLGVESGTAVVASARETPDQPANVTTLTQLTSSNVSGSQTTSEPTQTGSMQVPNAVAGQQTTAAPAQTGTIAGSNSVSGAESTAAPTESAALGQSSVIAGSQATVAPSQTGTALQPSVVSGTSAPAAPTETATLAWQSVETAQSPAAPTETEIVFQGSNVAATQSPADPSQSEALSQFAVAGTQSPAAALESTTLTQPSIVTGAQSTAQPTETATALQSNSVSATESTSEPRQLGQVAQAAAVAGTQSPTAPSESAAVVQGANVAGVEAPAQPAVTATLTQPSRVQGTQQPSQPANVVTLVQTSSVVGAQTIPAPDESVLLQQGSLVAGYQALEEPDQTGRVSQQYSVSGSQTTMAPSEMLQLFATSRVDSVCVTAAPEQAATIVTYQPATVFAQQSTSAPSETCRVSPAITLVRIRVSKIRSRAAMSVTLKAGEI